MRERIVVADAVRTGAGVLGDAILISDNKVTAIGMAQDLRGDRAEERYPGCVIVPGLRDAHFHPVNYAAGAAGVSLKAAADFADLGNRLRDAARPLRPGQALVAMRLDDEGLAEQRLPTRHDLDAMFPERPVLLHRYCGHIAVVNTAALDLAGVSPDTPDPVGGSLDRDEGGMPTGVLRETAVDLVARPLGRHAPPPLTPEQLVSAVTGLAATGLTGIGAIVGCGGGTWADLGDQVARIAEVAPDLPIRLEVLVIADTPLELERAAALVDGAGPYVTFLGLKAFGDGSLGGHTAAMHRGFADRPGETGTVRLDPAWAEDMSRVALGMGGRVAIHAIGDRANAMVLDLFEGLAAGGADPGLLRVEHASVLTRDDVARFGDGGFIASVQPAFLASETRWLEKRLGAGRIKLTYPFRSLLDAGARLAGGSDCPVEPPHPLAGMAVARDRAGIVPEEGLTGAEALSLFTDWAAAALGQPEPLAPGSPADFVVLDTDPVTADPDEVRTARVVETWVDGRPVAVPADALGWSE